MLGIKTLEEIQQLLMTRYVVWPLEWVAGTGWRTKSTEMRWFARSRCWTDYLRRNWKADTHPKTSKGSGSLFSCSNLGEWGSAFFCPLCAALSLTVPLHAWPHLLLLPPSPSSTKMLCVIDLYQYLQVKEETTAEHKARNNLKLNITDNIPGSLIGISQRPFSP